MKITAIHFLFDTYDTRKPITIEEYLDLVGRVRKAVEGFGTVDVVTKRTVPDDYQYPEPSRPVNSSNLCRASSKALKEHNNLSWPSEDSIAADLVIDDLCGDDSSDDGDDGF